ncbi:unnamed protein product [Durusdinium trenchii]|uniref:Uncharacterized protein n=1 Tax=Durusdinium trenchii TaxID=1381693 RepID=A0ABP0SPE5_9DINO
MASEFESQISSDSQTESDELRGVHGFHLRIAQVRACCKLDRFDSKGCVCLYRCLRISCASVIMVLSSLGAFLLGTCQVDPYVTLWDPDEGSFVCEIAAATRYLDMSYWGLMASTTVAGCGAMWLWCHAATPHLIQASRFLILNWIQGLVFLSFILATRTFSDQYNGKYVDGSWPNILLVIRGFLLLCELVSLQALNLACASATSTWSMAKTLTLDRDRFAHTVSDSPCGKFLATVNFLIYGSSNCSIGPAGSDPHLLCCMGAFGLHGFVPCVFHLPGNIEDGARCFPRVFKDSAT